jgi:hypothetical protein
MYQPSIRVELRKAMKIRVFSGQSVLLPKFELSTSGIRHPLPFDINPR